MTLYLRINRQSVVFFWPVRLPDVDGKDNAWWKSAREAAALAETSWIRVKPNMSIGGYDMWEPESVISEPEWPALDYWALIKIAFKDHLITSLDHPVIKRLRGQA